MTILRGCVAAFGALLILAGLVGFVAGPDDMPAFPAIPVIIFGALLLISILAEPVYGKLVSRPPLSGGWRPSGEKFIDPASGKPVEVWFDPDTGERRYVDIEGEKRQ